MDHLGLDAAYRQRTHCTLYTLEEHIHFLHEVRSSDEIAVATTILDFDHKRIHAGFQFTCARLDSPAATVDMMLLHVHQGATPASAPFPRRCREETRGLEGIRGLARSFRPRVAKKSN